MRITHAEKWRVVVPLRAGVLSREGRYAKPGAQFDATPKWIVRLHSDDGLTGLGESWRGESEEAVDAAIAAVVGTDPRRLPLHGLPVPPGASYTTIEMALFDLLGRHWQVPAHQLLGGALHERIRVASWAGRHGPEELAALALQARRRGFSSFKLKAALADPPRLVPPGQAPEVVEDDPVLEAAEAIRAACGEDFSLMIDANCRFYDVDRALAVARGLEGRPVVLEDPLSWEDDLDAYVRLRRESPVPIAIHVPSTEAIAANTSEGALGYAVHDRATSLLLSVIERGAADAVNLGGSMAQFVRLAWLAGEAGLSCWHESGVDLGIRDASYVHASFAAASCTLPGDMVGNFLREDDLIEEPLPIVDGAIARPEAPGLGVRLDEEALARYAVPAEGAARHAA